MRLGVNIFPRRLDATEFVAAQAQTLRYALRRDSPPNLYRDFAEVCVAAGILPVPVLARESFTGQERRTRRYREGLIYWRDRLPSVTTWQVGNEPDHESPRSWTMARRSLNSLLRAARSVLGSDVTIVGPGLVSGQPGWLDGVDLSPVNAIAVHPYVKRPTRDFDLPDWGLVGDLLAGYQEAAPGLPIWITEFGAKGPPADDRDFDDEDQRAEYHFQMFEAFREAGVETALVFRWDEDLGEPGFGLLDAGGDPKATYHAFANAPRE